jgi:N-methylhydantoinase B
MQASVDPVTVELVKGAVQSARGEMEALIERTSMSPFIREKKDYFTALHDAQGNLIVATKSAVAGNALDCILEQYPAGTMQDGDLYLYNDPYVSRGAVSHMPDMVFAAPVYHQERLAAFSVCWGHLWDIGGSTPGSISPAATEIFHEGVMVPPVRVARGGRRNEEVLRMFLRNSRFPEMVRGDLNAIMGATLLGRQRIGELFARFGFEATQAAFERLLSQSEAAVRQALETRVPNGVSAFEDFLDNDAVTEQSYAVRLTLRKEGGRLELDYTRSDDQARGAVNFIMHESVPTYILGLYLTAAEPDVMLNDGFRRAVAEVRTRRGSLVDPVFPAPLGMRANTKHRVISTLFGALGRATGGQAPAASPVYVIYNLRSRDPDTGRFRLCVEGLAIGTGGRPFADGVDGVYYVAQKNYPVEFAEMEFGLRVEGYRIHEDSGGAGRYRGGCGIVRDIRILTDEATLGLRVENCRFPAWGMAGGLGAQPARVLVNPGTPQERELRPLSDGNRLQRGDLLRISTSGGGGWGDPLERPLEAVRDDVLNGFVSSERAQADYGVSFAADGVTVDAAATERQRTGLRAASRRGGQLFHRNGAYYTP